MTCQLVCAPPDEAARTWPHVRDLIFAAMKRGDLGSFRPVEASVLGGEALLWLAIARAGDDGARIQAAAVTELHQSEWRKVCVVVACGGRDDPGRRYSPRPRYDRLEVHRGALWLGRRPQR